MSRGRRGAGDRTRLGAAVALWLVVSTAAAGAHAAGPAAATSRAQQARALAEAGRCDAAIDRLGPLLREPAPDAAVSLLAVQCFIRLGRYESAWTLLQPLRRDAPDASAVTLYLGIVAFHRGDTATALRALARARQKLPDRPEPPLYQGFVLYESGRLPAAIDAFDRARALGASRADPMASYYAGLAAARLGQRTRAREDLERVVLRYPESEWAARARSALERLEPPRTWNARLTGGVESDSNVVLQADDVPLPSDISDESDWRYVWWFTGSLGALWIGGGELGVTATYGGTENHELESFDVHYPSAAAWWRRPIGRSDLLSFQYRYGHAWVDDAPFVAHHALGAKWIHAWSEGTGRTTFGVRAYSYDYDSEPADIADGTGQPGDPCPPGLTACGTPGVDEGRRRARSGYGYEAAAVHDWPVPGAPSVVVQPSLLFQQYFAHGPEASYLRIESAVGARAALAFGVRGTLRFAYGYRPFRGASSLPDPATVAPGRQFQPTWTPRQDHILQASVGLKRVIHGPFTIEAAYRYLDNRSTLRSATYDRHIVGGYVSAGIGN